MTKKILALFMATTMTATILFGCGSTENTNNKIEDTSAGTNESVSTNADDEKVTIEVAVSGSAQEIAIHQVKSL